MSLYVQSVGDGVLAARSVEEVRAVIDGHAVASVSGLCVKCGTRGPCQQRRDALSELAGAQELPRRVAGATRPDLIYRRVPRLAT